mgnify:CR=1 FL=1
MPPKPILKDAGKEPQWNHTICAKDFETGQTRCFDFVTQGDQFLLVKETKPFTPTKEEIKDWAYQSAVASNREQREVMGLPNEEWEELFEIFTKGDNNLGSSGWMVAPSTVKQFIREILARAVRDNNEKIRERIEGMKKLLAVGPEANKQVNWKKMGFNQAIDEVLELMDLAD